MRLGGQRRSVEIEDRRGIGMGRGLAGGGIGAVVIALVAMFFGVDPSLVLQGMSELDAPQQQSAPPADDRDYDFVSAVLGSTEDTWTDIFARGGKTYRKPVLVLFSGAVQSACGFAQAAVGPFYCPTDNKMYIDLAFFEELRTRFKAPGDFARAYVIAHEVGHHVQNLLGVSSRVHEAQGRDRGNANALSVRLELQADCLAGVWAARNPQLLEAGDVEEGLAAASAVGDDRLQMQARGYVSPESFTHGSAAQRKNWFETGLKSGDPGRCDTFKAARL